MTGSVVSRVLAPDAVDRLVRRFDHHSPEVAADPLSVYVGLREQCPVAHSDAWGGFWVVASHELVEEVAHDDARFVSGEGVSFPAAGNSRPLIPIEVDPPELLEYRRLLAPLFAPSPSESRATEIRAIAGELLDAFAARGSADLVAEYAEAIPARLTMRMTGLPEERWRFCLDAIHTGVHESAHDLDKAVEAFLDVAVLLAEAIEVREDPASRGDDIISYLLSSEIDGRSISEEEILDICLLVLLGGLDTTASVIGLGLRHLGEHPAERSRLIEHPEWLGAAVEEYLRYFSPVQGLARTASCDAVVGGAQISAGDKLWVLWASANHDPAEFADPGVVRLDRSPNRHMAFGVGLHRCLGSSLARVMTRVAFEELLARIPDYELATNEAHVVEDTAVVYALTTLPVTFSPSPAVGR